MRSSNVNGRHPRSTVAFWRHPNRHMTPLSCYTRRRIFYGLSIRGSFIRYWIDTACPVTSLMRRIRADVEAALSADNSRKISEGSTFPNAREVTMTMSEYEERFRPPAPSLHQTFAEVRRPSPEGTRSRRLWVMAALLGVMTITSKAALHHSSHANDSQTSKAGIQACDFIPR
jgi:hypothetical protein